MCANISFPTCVYLEVFVRAVSLTNGDFVNMLQLNMKLYTGGGFH